MRNWVIYPHKVLDSSSPYFSSLSIRKCLEHTHSPSPAPATCRDRKVKGFARWGSTAMHDDLVKQFVGKRFMVAKFGWGNFADQPDWIRKTYPFGWIFFWKWLRAAESWRSLSGGRRARARRDYGGAAEGELSWECLSFMNMYCIQLMNCNSSNMCTWWELCRFVTTDAWFAHRPYS